MRPIPEYKPSDKLIAEKKAIEHVYNPDDAKLFGRSGWLWQCPSGRYAAVLTSPRLINSRFGDSEHQYKANQHLTVYFAASQLKTVVKLLRVPTSQSEQVELAQAFEELELCKNEPVDR